MQRLQQELWAVDGPRTHTHVGDLAWWVGMHVGREHEWKRRLWLEDDRCVAWAWLDLPASIDYEVDRGHRGGPLHEDLLDWFEAEAEGDGPLRAWHMEGDDASLELLSRRGYARDDAGGSYLYHVRELDEPIPEPEVPGGFRLRAVRGADDLRERVLVHQAVWAPSRVTEESYRNVMRTWPYRADLDCIAESADGTFAAYALAWLDDENRVGELEPVGTHPDHRRRGLGRAVNLLALHRLRHAGAELAIVLCRGDEAYPVPKRLYEAVGFRRHSRIVGFRKARP
jgi:ribosomal protein S18 acetylase RimI-like enzyme